MQKSLDFALLSLQRLDQAKSESEEHGEPEKAIETLSDGLLDLLYEEREEGEGEREIVVPIYLQTQLLLAR
jgi:S-adenosylmethionine synthetase